MVGLLATQPLTSRQGQPINSPLLEPFKAQAQRPLTSRQGQPINNPTLEPFKDQAQRRKMKRSAVSPTV